MTDRERAQIAQEAVHPMVDVPSVGDLFAHRTADGGAFLFDSGDEVESLWGDGDRTVWAAGESLMLYSPPGCGKTTIAGVLVRARVGLASTVLGMPVQAGKHRVLYLAMDRPKQIRRALLRQFTADEREVLDARLVVWRGPLADDLAGNPRLFLELAGAFDADTIVVDSIKDTGIRLTEDAGGLAYNIARQHALAEGVEFLELHHARKVTSDGRKVLTIDDVYGSVHLAAGAGTVLALSADARGNGHVEGVKMPSGEFGPRAVVIDKMRGTVTLADRPRSHLEVLRASTFPLSAAEVAERMEPGGASDRAAVARARRALDAMTANGQAQRSSTASANGGPDRVTYSAVGLAEGEEW